MPYKKIDTLSESFAMDLEILNDLAANDAYFESIIPDVYIRENITGTVQKSLNTVNTKIQGGSVSVAAFSGPKIIYIPWIISHTATYFPPITATAVTTSTVTCTVTSWNSKGFNVRLSPAGSGKLTSLRINWIALTQY